MLALAALSMTLLASPDPWTQSRPPVALDAPVASRPKPAKFELWLGALGGVHSDASTATGPTAGGGGQGSLAFSYKATRVFEPEVVTGLGAFANPSDLLLRIAFGTKVKWPSEGSAPFLWLAFNHSHEVGFDAALADPAGALMSHARTVRHRSGGELGVGIVAPIEAANARYDLSFRVLGLGFLDRSGPREWLLAEVAFGLPI